MTATEPVAADEDTHPGAPLMMAAGEGPRPDHRGGNERTKPGIQVYRQERKSCLQ